MDTQTVFAALNVFGLFVFAVSGALTALRNDLDILSVIMTAFVTGVGGGTIRAGTTDLHGTEVVLARPLPVAPRQLPYQTGYVYFELDRSSEFWAGLETFHRLLCEFLE